MQKGTNRFLNLNNRILGRLKVHVINQKTSCTDGGKPKKIHFEWPVTLSGENLVRLSVLYFSSQPKWSCIEQFITHRCTDTKSKTFLQPPSLSPLDILFHNSSALRNIPLLHYFGAKYCMQNYEFRAKLDHFHEKNSYQIPHTSPCISKDV